MSTYCEVCENKIKTDWKYCRFCGNALTVAEVEETTVVEEVSLEDLEMEEEVVEHIKFDRELYYNVLVARSERSRIAREKSQIKTELRSLREQWNSGLISENYAKENMLKFKGQVSKLVEREKEFAELPEDLPLETLVDEINSVKKRVKKIEGLKKDEGLSKGGIRDAIDRAKSSMDLLRDEHSKIAGHIRTWQSELNDRLRDARKEMEQLNIKFKIDEITESNYGEKKNTLVTEIEDLDNVLGYLERMIKV